MNWHEYFYYKDGKLIWKIRPLSHFSEVRVMNKCNTQYAGKVAGCLDDKGCGYILLHIYEERFLAHRVIWEMINGSIPKGMQVDHINHIRNDNRIENLRLVSKQCNQKNLSMNKRNKTGISGVTINKHGKYFAQIGVRGKTTSLGYYDNIFDAACARKAAEINLLYHKNHGVKDVPA